MFYLLFFMILICLFLINTILGIFLNTSKEGFCLKKFFYGFLKLFIVSICSFLYLLILEITPIILNRIGIDITSDMVCMFEFLSLFLTVYKKYSLDIFDKIKNILNLL